MISSFGQMRYQTGNDFIITSEDWFTGNSHGGMPKPGQRRMSPYCFVGCTRWCRRVKASGRRSEQSPTQRFSRITSDDLGNGHPVKLRERAQAALWRKYQRMRERVEGT